MPGRSPHVPAPAIAVPPTTVAGMVAHDAFGATRDAYDAVAPTYARIFADSLRDSPLDRAILGAFAEVARASGDGRVADLGCGPGHVTAHLAGLGLDAFGVDASPAMIELAREAHPGLRFDVGSMAALDLADGVLGGVLSRWSVIHTPPSEVPLLLAEFHRVPAPGGHLLIGFSASEGPPVRHRSSTTRSRPPIAGGPTTSPRCCARAGWPRWPGWCASRSPPTADSSRRSRCWPARPRSDACVRGRHRRYSDACARGRYCRYPLRNRPMRLIAASRSSAWGRVRMRKWSGRAS